MPLLFVDGGAHNGVFSDVALACGAIVHAFEPNKYLCAFLRNYYQNNKHFILHQSAISIKNEKTIFYNVADSAIDQGASIIKTQSLAQSSGYEVQMIDFCAFLLDMIKQYGKITMIKLDIEGAEFEVLESIITKDLYKHIDYIMVETHERFFANPKAILENLKRQITQKDIKNIYLDWI